LKQSLEPILADMEKLRSSIEAANSEEEKDALMAGGFAFMRQLRKLRKEGEAQIAEGKKQGQDVVSLEGVVAEVNKSYDWAEKALTGTEEE
ncbi:hypothetical protein Q8G48_28310, partial [Klebsiella pneumoniae]|uniref:hypothetical protein n=1 Tax=Klebsiella pneumoniae TaxID=573 RepID=UPI0030141BDB